MNRRTGKLISILYRKGQIYIDHALKDDCITASEVPVLFSLYEQDGITQEELVLLIGLDKSAVTRILQSLIGKNYVIKEKDKKDLRCNRIYLTPNAFAIQDKVYGVLDDWNSIVMQDFNDAERNQAYDLIKRMVNNIQGEKE